MATFSPRCRISAARRRSVAAGRCGCARRHQKCGEILEQFAERLASPIIKALLGKAAVPDDSPYTTGGIGLLGTKPSQDALEKCDTLWLT
jgi:thiamine pyrophosphate-dependent acetolactate synthase large subunit-like protein